MDHPINKRIPVRNDGGSAPHLSRRWANSIFRRTHNYARKTSLSELIFLLLHIFISSIIIIMDAIIRACRRRWKMNFVGAGLFQNYFTGTFHRVYVYIVYSYCRKTDGRNDWFVLDDWCGEYKSDSGFSSFGCSVNGGAHASMCA